MSGSVAGGRKAAKTNQANYDKVYLEKYGMTFYQYVGQRGGSGRRPETRPFFTNRSLAREAGARGGTISRKPKKEATDG